MMRPYRHGPVYRGYGGGYGNRGFFGGPFLLGLPFLGGLLGGVLGSSFFYPRPYGGYYPPPYGYPPYGPYGYYRR